MLRLLSHKNIVKLKEAVRRQKQLFLVFEYVDCCLLEVIEKSCDGIPGNLIKTYMFQILEAMDYMHSQNVIHRDIKPENILVSNEQIIKICDFGFAREITN